MSEVHGTLPAALKDRLPCRSIDIVGHELGLHVSRDEAQCHYAEFARTLHQVLAVLPDELFPIGKWFLETIQSFASWMLDESPESTNRLEGPSARVLMEHRPPCLKAVPSSSPQSWFPGSYTSVTTWSKMKPSSAAATSQALTLSMYVFSKLASISGLCLLRSER